MKGLNKVEWSLGEVLSDPQKLFVLWAVKERFCVSLHDFHNHYGPDFPIAKLVGDLRENGFLRHGASELVLTETGEQAVAHLGDNEFSPYAASQHDQQLHQDNITPMSSLSQEAAVLTAKERLSAALSHLASVQRDLNERLMAWREQLARGTINTEAAVRAVLTAGRSGTVEVLRTMSHPSLQDAGMSVRGNRGEGQTDSAVVIATDAMPSARVAVEGDAVVVTLPDWNDSSPPLVVIVPSDERSRPQIADIFEGEGNTWTAQFRRIPPGDYLLAIAPVAP